MCTCSIPTTTAASCSRNMECSYSLSMCQLKTGDCKGSIPESSWRKDCFQSCYKSIKDATRDSSIMPVDVCLIDSNLQDLCTAVAEAQTLIKAPGGQLPGQWIPSMCFKAVFIPTICLGCQQQEVCAQLSHPLLQAHCLCLPRPLQNHPGEQPNQKPLHSHTSLRHVHTT